MRAVNLLPRPEERSRALRLNGGILVAGSAPVVATLLVAGAYMFSSGPVASKEQTLAGLETELAGLPMPKPPDPANAALSRETGERILAVGSALSDRVAVDRILREISLILPEDVWLSGLTIKSSAAAGTEPEVAPQPASAEGASAEGGAAAEGGEGAAAPPQVPEGVPTPETSGFVLIGYTYSQEGVARMLSRLSVLPHLANVQLAQSLRVPAGKRSVVQFTILADLRSPKESS